MVLTAVFVDRPCVCRSRHVSHILCACHGYQEINDYDIIIGGRQAIDGDTAQVGPQVAEKLGLTQITYAEEILNVDKEAGRITVNVISTGVSRPWKVRFLSLSP